MKKIVITALILMTLLLLAACGSTGNSPSSSGKADNNAADSASKDSGQAGGATTGNSAAASGSGTAKDTTAKAANAANADANTGAAGSATTENAADSAEKNSPANTQAAKPEIKKQKVLVVYFSRVGSSSFGKDVDVVSSASLTAGDAGFTGNTKVIANIVKEATGGDIFQIVTAEPYPGDYRKTIEVALKEQREGARPKLATHVENMNSYDVILLGYPNWSNTIPMPVFTFLEEYDFSGKIVAPFCTNDVSGLGSSVADVTRLCPKATIPEGLAIRSGDVKTAQGKVSEWLRKIGIVKS